MGSHHLLGGSTGPGWKMSHFVMKKKLRVKNKKAASHPGPVLPPSGEGSPSSIYQQPKLCCTQIFSIRFFMRWTPELIGKSTSEFFFHPRRFLSNRVFVAPRHLADWQNSESHFSPILNLQKSIHVESFCSKLSSRLEQTSMSFFTCDSLARRVGRVFVGTKVTGATFCSV